MSAAIVATGRPGHLRLEGELTIYTAAELRARLLEVLPGTGALELNLSAVSELDSAGLQLLVAAGRAAQANGRRLQLVDPSQAVLAVLATLGLAPGFADTPPDAVHSA